MPRPRPPHLNRETTRHGRIVWYVRVGQGARRRINAPFGTPEFWTEYHAAVAGTPAPRQRSAARSGTLAWLVERYKDSAAWATLSMATRRQRQNILIHIVEKAGDAPFAAIDRTTIAEGRDRRAATPAAARHFVQTMRALFEWATESGFTPANPADGIKVKRPRTAGHIPWTEEDCRKFEAHWPTGTRQRLAYDILLHTGLRRGDVVRLGRQHIKNGMAKLPTEKTGEVAYITIAPELAASIAAGPCGDLAFIAGENGRPLTKESFGTLFRDWCNAAGVDKSAHGLRKTGATRAADVGASEHELMARFAWSEPRTAAIYTRQADRERLARGLGDKLQDGQTGNIYSRTSPSGAGRKPKTEGNSDG